VLRAKVRRPQLLHRMVTLLGVRDQRLPPTMDHARSNPRGLEPLYSSNISRGTYF
jgi:hypothetical protein